MVKELRLTVLNDNEPGEGLINDWGWSVLLESEKWKALFDADTEGRVLEHNSRKLGKSLNNLDFAFLSHYHRDHYGGFSYIGKIKEGLKIYVPVEKEFLREWGLRPTVAHKGEIEKDVFSTGLMGASREQAMGIRVDSLGIVVVVGCSHPGVDILAETLRELIDEDIYMVIGGFHSPLRKIIDRLARVSNIIIPAHCSGERTKRYVKKKYPEKFREVRTGSVVEIGNF